MLRLMIQSVSAVLLLLSVGCATAPISPAGPALVEAEPEGYAILQGVSGETWVRLNVLRRAGEKLSYAFYGEPGASGATADAKAPPLVPRTHVQAPSDWVVDELEIPRLSPGVVYQFLVRDEAGVIRDQRAFRTVSAQPGPARFAVVSCADDRYPEQKEMWRGLINQKPSWILAIGDNSYADSRRGKDEKWVNPEMLWTRYAETRQKLEIFRAKNLIPMVALWDDHDFGMNGGDRSNPYKEEARVVFNAFFPQTDARAPEFEKGPGVSSIWRVAENTFYLLDARTFRSPGAPAPACLTHPGHTLCQWEPAAAPKDETRFSKEQLAWFFGALAKDQGSAHWLAEGDQWFGAYQPFESFEARHPKSFAAFMAKLKRARKHVVFLAGDRHASEISRIEKSLLGYETFEIVSSPVHARVYPSSWNEFPNRRQVAAVANTHNYTIIETENPSPGPWRIHVRSLKKDEVPAYDVNLTVPTR